jgi:undecaprenyl diphosphate synthase
MTPTSGHQSGVSTAVAAAPPDISPLPAHVGIIMDGNGRWAEKRGLPRVEGHRRGADSVRDVVRASRAIGLKALTLYAFSSQNWARPPAEVARLMELLKEYIEGERTEIMENGIRLLAVGEVTRLPSFVRGPLDGLIADSASHTGMTLCLALSYGGREALVEATRSLAARVEAGTLQASAIGADTVKAAMSTRSLPDVDLVIRTSGEKRISNFLLWEAAYAELWFTDVLWPDFTRKDLYDALGAYAQRERRFGLSGEQLRSDRLEPPNRPGDRPPERRSDWKAQ